MLGVEPDVRWSTTQEATDRNPATSYSKNPCNYYHMPWILTCHDIIDKLVYIQVRFHYFLTGSFYKSPEKLHRVFYVFFPFPSHCLSSKQALASWQLPTYPSVFELFIMAESDSAYHKYRCKQFLEYGCAGWVWVARTSCYICVVFGSFHFPLLLNTSLWYVFMLINLPRPSEGTHTRHTRLITNPSTKEVRMFPIIGSGTNQGAWVVV